MRANRGRWLVILTGVAALGLGSAVAYAQASSSAARAAELVRLMDDAGLSAIAVDDPAEEERYVAALYIAGSQLLAVSASYAAPILLDQKIVAGRYRDVYVDLNSASAPESRLFIDDLGADGLRAAPIAGGSADTCDRGGTSLVLDGDLSGQQMSQEEYGKAFADVDSDYTEMLRLLIAQIKQSS